MNNYNVKSKEEMNAIKFSKIDSVKLYKMILKGDMITRFPPGFWKRPGAKENGSECIKYLIEDILKYDDDTLKQKSLMYLFKKYKLAGMINVCFNGSAYDAINNTYPNRFNEWEFNYTPRGYWSTRENGIKVTKWLIEEKLKLKDEELKEQLSIKMFEDNGLSIMLKRCFDNNPYEAINSVYPSRFKKIEFRIYK